MKKVIYTIFIFFIVILVSCKKQNFNDAFFDGLNNEEIYVGETFKPLSYVFAYDFDNTDITDDIIVEGEVDVMTPGTYELTYKITGKNGHTVNEKRMISVLSKAPVITDDKRVIEIELGDEIPLLICLHAFDDVDQDITDQIKVIDDGGFDKDKSGTYIITYEVIDSQGQIATHKRKIIVREARLGG